mgnify:CR=1 FL=1
MCPLCNGTGGVTINFGTYAEFHPCKHPECDFDREKAMCEEEALIKRFKAEIYARENAS